MCNRKNVVIIVISIIVIAVLGFSIKLYNMFRSPNFNLNGKTTYVKIYPNTTFDELCAQLEDSAACRDIADFKRIAKALNYPERMKTGNYKVVPDMSNEELVKALRNGSQEAVRVTFNNVRLKDELADKLAAQLMVNRDSLLYLFNDSAYCASMGFTPETIIAMFVPNTYELYWNTSEDKLMKRMKREYEAFWNDERKQKAANLGLSPLEVSTLASIVEEESAATAEYPMIAGLYLNRLNKGMLLQADPTVKFALGDFSIRRVLYEHLEVDSPYNTYKYAGLPPGPLRCPSIKAIDGVLNRSDHNYLYMCAKEDFSGTHNFAVTLAQHSANARRFQAALNKKGIK